VVNQLFRREVLLAAQALHLPPYRDASNQDLPNTKRAIGVDVGRTNDVTAVVWLMEYPRGMFRVERCNVMRKTRFAEQRRCLQAVLAYGRENGASPPSDREYRVGYVHAAEIDATHGSLGMQLAEELREDFPAVLRCSNFTAQLKEELFGNLLVALENGHMQIDPEMPGAEQLLSALGAMRREFRPGGGIRYEAARTEEGHADEAVALALALHRLREGAGNWRVTDDSDALGLDKSAKSPLDAPSRSGILQALGAEREPGLFTADDLGVTRYTEDEMREQRRLRERGWTDEDL
jgi:phage FluMu gp28-like protein